EGQQRYLFALTMDRFQHPQPLPAPKPRPTWSERFQSWIKSPPLVLATTGSAVLVVLIAVLFLPRMMSGGGGVFEGPTLVGSFSSRGEGAPPVAKIKLPDNVAKLKLRLLLPKGSPAATRYKAELDNKVNRSPVDEVEFDNEAVSVTIPTKAL